MPEEARPRPGPRSFTASATALLREVGAPTLAIFGAFAVAVAVAATTTSLEAARLFYLRGATFHSYLEIALAILLVLEGRPHRA